MSYTISGTRRLGLSGLLSSLVLLGGGAAALPSCSSSSNDVAKESRCIADSLRAQATHRFVQGNTFYLPTLGADVTGCGAATWKLTSAPAASTNELVVGADGITRFTPVEPGTYTFDIQNVADEDKGTLQLTVIGAEGLPFYNLNYYPSGSAQNVGGELWVANVQKPTISRVDPKTMDVLGEIPVGPWPVSLAYRDGMSFAVVAQRGNDTLGLVDITTHKLIDAIWVGDEPANVVLSPDGKTAYLALKSDDSVAVVDLVTRNRTAKISVVRDPLAMAVSPSGDKLFVASHRSGQPSRYPYPESDPIEEERDVAVVDLKTNTVSSYWLDLGTTQTAFLMNEAGTELYMARLRNDTTANLGKTDENKFFYEVAVHDPNDGKELRKADIGRQATTGGLAVTLHGMTLAAGKLWVVAEGSDLAIALDPMTLEEVGRVATEGRPRSIAEIDNAVFVHGAQKTTITKIEDLKVVGAKEITKDPRPALIAQGQAYFTGAGKKYADTWSCNSCHADGLSDTLVWNAGPFSGWKVSRPFFWLEGTYPLGWDGYLSSVDNYALTVNTNVGQRVTTQQHEALSAYMASTMAPPRENEYTRRDGTLSELGAKGKEIFEGKAACSACHPLPLTTNRALSQNGITEGVTDIPGLIGAYRLGVWLKRGEATTLKHSVDTVFQSLGLPALAADEREALDRYLLELTARDFMVLSSEPRPNSAAVAVDQSFTVTFSHAVWSDATNLQKVTMKKKSGEAVAVDRKLSEDGRHLTLKPSADLDFGTEYTIVVDPNFEAQDEQKIWTANAEKPTAWEIPVTTAKQNVLKLSGDYLWTVDMPTADPSKGTFNRDNIIPTLVQMKMTENKGGAAMLVDYGQNLILPRIAVVSGDTLIAPPLPIPIGPSFADSSGLEGKFEDLDNDGVGDYAEGTLTISGPGFLESGIVWRLSRPISGPCTVGPKGTLPMDITFDVDKNPVINWGASQAIGLYLIDPAAQPPTGPGQPVSNGEAYWAVQTSAFPEGFVGPVTYGVLPSGGADATSAVGGASPGAAVLVSGQCYKAAIITTSFEQGSYTFLMP